MKRTIRTLLCCALLAVTAVSLPAAIAGIPFPTSDEGLPTLAPVLRGVTPAVVNISVTAASSRNANPLLRDPFFRRFFNLPAGQSEQEQSAGSGVIVDAAKGYVVTNHHVIENAHEVTVTLKDRRRFQASLVGSDPGTDIALLQIDAKNLAALEIGDSDELEVGDFVVAIGNPFGLGQTVTSGIVSALGRSGLNIEGYEDFIQTDASINPGNSGGALVDLKGRLIGVNTAIIGPSGGNVGIGFAVPSNMALSVIEQLVSHGRVRRGRLGIQIQELNPDLAQALKLAPSARGVVITRVENGSSAHAAGLRPGDVVTDIDGRPVEDLVDLRNHIGLTPVGKFAGAVFRDVEETDPFAGEVEGVVIDEVSRDSPAWQQGLRPNDIIFGLNQSRVHSLQQLAGVLRKSGGALAFNILRKGTRLLVIVQ
jgi:serine protease Do/serine protease DegQ